MENYSLRVVHITISGRFPIKIIKTERTLCTPDICETLTSSDLEIIVDSRSKWALARLVRYSQEKDSDGKSQLDNYHQVAGRPLGSV